MTPELSILVAAHHEGLIAHKTMLSLERALEHIGNTHYEIIVTIDNGDDETKRYFKEYKSLPITTYEIDERDLAASRNFAVKKSTGKYISIVDADDLISENWISESLDRIRNSKDQVVLHTSFSVNFGTHDVVWEKFDSRSRPEDATIMVWANRWDSAITTQREVLESFPYQPNTNGFGSEDWHFNSQTLASGIPHKVVDRTVLFVRRKDVSEMTIQASDRRTVHYTNLLSFDSLRESPFVSRAPESAQPQAREVSLRVARRHIKSTLKPILRPVHRIAKQNHFYNNFSKRLLDKNPSELKRFPNWLLDEWRAIHKIEKAIFPSRHLTETIPIYHSEMYDLGERFRRIVNQFSVEPDYIIFLPSLLRGGAELVALNFISALQANFPNWKIAVVATENFEHPWSNRLPEDVDYVEFGKYTDGLSYDHKLSLLARLIVQSKTKKIHIAQSALMYRFASLYAKLLSNYSVSSFAFCEDEDNEGRISGHIHSGLPIAYPVITKVFTDNNYVIDQLVREYAFDKEKFSTLYQPFNGALQKPITHNEEPLKILWASRISKQKRPDILVEIAKRLTLSQFKIDMYGLLQDGYTKEDFSHIPTLTYRGEFNSINELPLRDYDLFIYTSENDGIPNILIEVSAAGIPIIAPNVGGIAELLGRDSSQLIKDYENINEYVATIKAFLALDMNGRSQIARDVQKTIKSQHAPEAFNKAVKELFS